MIRRLRWATLVLLTACGGTEATPVVPGELVVRVVGQGLAPGAMVLTISGGPITKVTPATGIESAIATDAIGSHLMLVGTLASGDLAVLTIPDHSLAVRYVVSINQVADGESFALLDPAQRTASLVVRP